MANSTSVTVACPRCRRTAVIPLVRDGDRQRFECSSCGDTFWSQALPAPNPQAQTAPSTATSFVPIAIPEATAGPAGSCEKCGKPYFRLGKKYDQHVASCDGKAKYVAPKKRSRRPIDVVLPPSAAEIYARSLAALRARKDALEAEVRGVDAAIAEIEGKMKGAGGPAPVPFVAGSPPTS